MKILMINSVCGIRSTGRICTDLAQALEAQGHEVRIAYGRETVPPQFERFAMRIGTPFGVRLHALKARLFDASGFGSYFATKRFLDQVRAFDPDVIHLHNIHGYYIHVGLLFDYLRSCGKRIIWTLHDCWAFTGHSPLCELRQCERWIIGCGACPLKKKYPASLIDRSRSNWKRKQVCFSEISDLTIVTPSRWLADRLSLSFLSGIKHCVIHNGIDTREFHPGIVSAANKYSFYGKRILLSVSTVWDDTKGLSDYISLAERLGDPWRVVLVGMTEKEILRLPSYITGIPRTASAAALAEYYASADLLLNFSYCETYPTVNLESEACGTPVITYDVGGGAETVFPGCGWVIPRGDLDAAERLIRSLWADSDGPARIFPALSELDKQSMRNAYLSVYSERN